MNHQPQAHKYKLLKSLAKNGEEDDIISEDSEDETTDFSKGDLSLKPIPVKVNDDGNGKVDFDKYFQNLERRVDNSRLKNDVESIRPRKNANKKRPCKSFDLNKCFN